MLKVFEKKYPDDKRPRLAIKAAKDFLAGKINTYAADAAANAADAAANAKARDKMNRKLTDYALEILGA